MGVYYFAANHTKKEMFWPDFLAENWSIKLGCIPAMDHPFGLGLNYMMAYDWRGDHVVIANDTNPEYEECNNYRCVDEVVRSGVMRFFDGVINGMSAQEWFMSLHKDSDD